MAIKENQKTKARLQLGSGHLFFKSLSDDFEYSTVTNNLISFKANAESQNDEIEGGNGQPIMIKNGATNYTIEVQMALLEPELANWLEGKVTEDTKGETIVPETTNAKVGSDGKIVIAKDDSDIKEIVNASVSLPDNTLLKKVEQAPQSGEFQIDTDKKALVFNDDLKGQDVVVHVELKMTNVRVIKTTKTPVRPEFELYHTTDTLPHGKKTKVRVTTKFMRVQLEQPVSIAATKNHEDVTISLKTLSSEGCQTAIAYEREIPNEVC